MKIILNKNKIICKHFLFNLRVNQIIQHSDLTWVIIFLRSIVISIHRMCLIGLKHDIIRIFIFKIISRHRSIAHV